MVLEKDLKRGAFPLTGAQHVWRCLEQEGVEVCFGYPGGAIMPVYDALPESSIHHVLCRHEQGAAHMADGYARATGRVGVALATSGPGATNLVTGIATAMLDSVPLVCITGQVPSHLLGTDAFQETDITGITMPITKHNYRVTRPEDVAPAIRDAFRVARSGRPGPVLIDITKDAQIGTCDIEAEAPARPLEPPDHPEPPGAALDAAAELINSAVRPLILAGHGVIQAEATGELLALAERADLPITTTLLGLGGVPASHPLHLGMPGMHGAATVNRAIQAADVLIAVGMRFDDRVTGNVSRFAPQARIIHLEIDPAEIGKNVSTDVGVLGDARASLRGLLKRVGPASHAAWRSQLAAWQADDNARDLLQRPDPEAFHAAHVMHDLWRYTQGDALIVSDVGQHQMWEAQYHPHEAPRTLLTSGGLGTMGFALPAAIGARFGRPEADIWVVAGDGGFQMTACELSTCAQEGLKVNIALINNRYLGMVRQWQDFFHDKRYVATPLKNPDFLKLAAAHGLDGRRVTARDQVSDAVAWAQAQPGTVVLEFQVLEEDAVYPMVPAGNDIDDMLRRPTKEG